MPIRSFRDLEVWQIAMELTDLVYELTEEFPRHELYGLTSQLRRAAVSIASNIAEGSRQRTTPLKIHYFARANASAAEIETQLEVSRRRRYGRPERITKAEELGVRVAKMLYRLIDSIDAGS